MITLVEPSPALRASWWGSVLEFADAHTHGYALDGFDRGALASDEGFSRWLAERREEVTAPAPGRVPATLRWVVDDADPERVLGSLQLRHALNDHLREVGGHVGYGIRPSARRQGVATGALRACLPEAARLGLTRLLVTCDEDNLGSRRTIERCGGVLEDVRAGKRRYRVPTQARAARA